MHFTTVLLDIEGTTSPLAYVHEVLFPFARRELPAFLKQHFHDAAFASLWNQVAADVGAENLDALARQLGSSPITAFQTTIERMMDADAKATGLKDLQGRIWKVGFERGELKAEMFEDVPRALQRWAAAQIGVRIYSSGSIAAQELYFGRTEFGDLRPYIAGYYDTTTGGKRDEESYRKIAGDIGGSAENILFLSDVVAELDAARDAGLQTGLMLRPGNAPVDGDHGHWMFTSFEEIQ